MPPSNYRQILDTLRRLSKADKKKLYQVLGAILFPVRPDRGKLLTELREGRFCDGFFCPRCGSRKVIRYGFYRCNGISRQRYRCDDCRRTFGDFTGTPLYRTRIPDRWMEYLDCMLDGLSLRRSAWRMGDMSYVTLFYWRHKILSALKKIDVKTFQGVVEMDETFFRYSEKGSRNIIGREPRTRGGRAKRRGISREQASAMVARDRGKQTFSKVSCLGRVSRTALDRLLGPRIDGEAILCTDAHSSYAAFARERGLRHYVLTKKAPVRERIYHIQNVNAYHRRLKSFMAPFNGVATKYLDNYLAWFRFYDLKKNEPLPEKRKDMMVSACARGADDTCRSLRESRFRLSS
jgi:transposase-like protein